MWGMISSVSTTTQTFGYATGESAQAIEAANYGARRMDRVRSCFGVSSVVALELGSVVAIVGLCFPEAVARLYMDVTDEVLGVVPHALRAYSLAFPLLVFNVSSTYCFQAVGWPLIATIASLMRGLVVPAVFAFALPVLIGPGAVWFAVPAGELITLVFVLSQLPLAFGYGGRACPLA